MSLKLYPLPLDRTGSDFRNKVTREYHDISDQINYDYRVIVLDKGHFYKQGLTIHDSFNNELSQKLDYQLTMFNSDIFTDTGLEACSVIVITNKDIIGKLYVTAQMVGGKYTSVAEAVISQTLGMLNNTRKLNYKNIKELPDTFNLNAHMHPYWDLYSFTPRTLKIKRIVDIFDSTIRRDLEEIYVEYNLKKDLHTSEKQQLDKLYSAHIANRGNPHKVTKLQVGLSEVVNGRLPTEAEVKSYSREARNLYLTPLRARQAVQEHVITRLTHHVGDTNNPHELDTVKLNTLTELEIDTLDFKYYNRDETVDFTYRLGGNKNAASNDTISTGLTFPEAYILARSNLHAPEIKDGTLKVTNLTNKSASVPSVLFPLSDGTLGWRSLEEIRRALSGNVYRVYHLNTSVSPNAGSAVARANANINPANLADGTMLLLKTYNYIANLWGNSHDMHYAYGTVILMVRNGQWVA